MAQTVEADTASLSIQQIYLTEPVIAYIII